MSGINRAFILGRVGQEPELKFGPTGIQILNLSVATSEKWKDKSGQDQERTEWHKISFFGKQAETVSKYIHKGDQIFIEGRLQTRSWEKDGQNHYTTEIIANGFQFVGGKRESKENQAINTGEANLVFPNAVATNEEWTSENVPF